MTPHTGDLARLLLVLPLLLVGLHGRSALRVDAENASMKSVGTATDAHEEVRAREFGQQHGLVLLASPVAGALRTAPELQAPDLRTIERWVTGLGSLPEVEALETVLRSDAGERGLLVTLRTGADGRYSSVVQPFVESARSGLPDGHSLRVGGVPVVELAIAREVSDERDRILPGIAVALALVLWIVYRSALWVVGALLAPLVSVLFLDGVQGELGLAIDPVSALLGPSVLTVGVAASVHVLERYRAALAGGTGRAAVAVASRAAARDLRSPLGLAVVTTIAGFLGLLASPIPAVQRFGLLASLGIATTTLVTLICLPSLLRLLHRPRPRPGRHSASEARERISGHPVFVVASTLILLVPAALGMRAVRVDSDPLRVLAEDHPTRVDCEEIGARLGASESFELLLPPRSTETPGAVFALGPLASLAPLAPLLQAVCALEHVPGPAGPPRVSEAGYRLLPFLVDRGSGEGGERDESVFDRAESAAREAGWSDAHATGLSVRMARDSRALVRGQRVGLLATTLALWIVMSVGLRSVRLGLLGLVPNLVPLVVVQGVMGWMGSPLTVAASMIGTVMLGLVIDDTIHFLHRYARTRGTPEQRVRATLDVVRRPILITTIVLSVGFSVTMLGNLTATREFGILAVSTLVLALLADLVVLPAVLCLRTPRGATAARTLRP